jgi:hypothetical protein
VSARRWGLNHNRFKTAESEVILTEFSSSVRYRRNVGALFQENRSAKKLALAGDCAEELNQLKNMIDGIGFYHQITGTGEYDNLKYNRVKIGDMFRRKVRQRLLEWMVFADRTLKGMDLKIFLTAGNDDDERAVAVIEENQTDRVLHSEGRMVMVDATHSMLTMSDTETGSPVHRVGKPLAASVGVRQCAMRLKNTTPS